MHGVKSPRTSNFAGYCCYGKTIVIFAVSKYTVYLQKLFSAGPLRTHRVPREIVKNTE